MSGCELAEIEQAAGQKCHPIGHIGYYYPAEVWISEDVYKRQSTPPFMMVTNALHGTFPKDWGSIK